jgi:hypothetical protein
MDSAALISAFTPSKILIQTSILPLISIDPIKKSWIGDFLNPKVYAVIGENIFKIDPAAGKVNLSSQAEVDALPNNWGNVIAFVLAVVFLIQITRKLLKKGG